MDLFLLNLRFTIFHFQFVKTFKFVLRLRQTETTAGVVPAPERAERGGSVSTNKVINQSNRKLFLLFCSSYSLPRKY